MTDSEEHHSYDDDSYVPDGAANPSDAAIFAAETGRLPRQGDTDLLNTIVRRWNARSKRHTFEPWPSQPDLCWTCDRSRVHPVHEER